MLRRNNAEELAAAKARDEAAREQLKRLLDSNPKQEKRKQKEVENKERDNVSAQALLGKFSRKPSFSQDPYSLLLLDKNTRSDLALLGDENAIALEEEDRWLFPSPYGSQF